ncbi:MAG: hypothetical protein GC189_07585 [Alphaproteobacteria bacterium]|nr:hypothetical protein [Alphaproteobacteria bacterium]
MRTSHFPHDRPFGPRAQLIAAMAAALALGSCASAPSMPPSPDLSLLRGCWIQRGGDAARTMRWFPDGAGWRGELLVYWPGNRRPSETRYRVLPAPDVWQVCDNDAARCWPLDTTLPTEADEPPSRATLVASASALVFDIHDGARLQPVFRGQRDGCD